MNNVIMNVLRVDLSTEEVSTIPVDLSLVEGFYGGRGLGIRMLWDEVGPQTEPLAPESKLIFTTSPLVGTLTPGASKLALTFKSPLTFGCFLSLCGGAIAPELRFTGYDGLIIEGKAKKPVYLYIRDEDVYFRDADDIWGKFTGDTVQIIKEREGDRKLKIACIGPAGERLVKYACIHAEEHREFGRGGGGAVMGSKMLKAIAIRGTRSVAVGNPDLLRGMASSARKALLSSEKVRIRNEYGTHENAIPINESGFWPVRNFTEGVLENIQDVDMNRMKEFVIRKETCYGCPVSCGKVCNFKASDGTVKSVAPEYESISMCGPNCGISSFNTILEMCWWCDQYGMDTITTGTAVSMVMEAFERGKLDIKATGGLVLRFGAEEASRELIKKIGERDGIGDILAEGVRTAAEKLGVPELAMEVKGLSLPAYDPRGVKGMGLNYATAAEGASHMRAPIYLQEMGAGTRLLEDNKATMVIDGQIAMAIVDSLCLCSSMRFALSTQNMLDFLKTVNGIEVSPEDADKAGRRVIVLERLYNYREGFRRKDDYLPKRFLQEPLAGPSQGATVNLEPMLDDYYREMGFDDEGIPKSETLEWLSLGGLH